MLAPNNSFFFCYLMFHKFSDAVSFFFLQKKYVFWALPPVCTVSIAGWLLCVSVERWNSEAYNFLLRLQTYSYCWAPPVLNYAVLFLEMMCCASGFSMASKQNNFITLQYGSNIQSSYGWYTEYLHTHKILGTLSTRGCPHC